MSLVHKETAGILDPYSYRLLEFVNKMFAKILLVALFGWLSRVAQSCARCCIQLWCLRSEHVHWKSQFETRCLFKTQFIFFFLDLQLLVNQPHLSMGI